MQLFTYTFGVIHWTETDLEKITFNTGTTMLNFGLITIKQITPHST